MGFVLNPHTGEMFPAGFMPVSGCNMLHDSLTDASAIQICSRRCATPRSGAEKCGVCEFVKVCGGSRSRAYAFTGDYLVEDPRCICQPHLTDALIG